MQIVASTYYAGVVTDNNNDMQNQINDEKSIISNVKVALPTVSEYLRSNSNKNSCGSLSLNNNNYDSCVNTGWMDTNATSWWTLSLSASVSGNPFLVYWYGLIDDLN